MSTPTKTMGDVLRRIDSLGGVLTYRGEHPHHWAGATEAEARGLLTITCKVLDDPRYTGEARYDLELTEDGRREVLREANDVRGVTHV
jgi:hypothetical protein